MELENIKEGDRVALVSYGGWSNRITAAFGTVERTTKTQIVAFGRRFMRRNGFEVGASTSFYSGPRLKVDTPEIRAEVETGNKEAIAERKVRRWAEILHRAKGDDAVKYAALLPPPPTGDT